MQTTYDINNDADIIDLRDVIARYCELRDADDRDPDDQEEYDRLSDLLADCQGLGGDEQFDGEWYPLTLIRDSYFEEYARELAADIGAIDTDAPWPTRHINWTAAAHELQQDYTGVNYAGVDYWTL